MHLQTHARRKLTMRASPKKRAGASRWQWPSARSRRCSGHRALPDDLDEMMFAGFVRKDAVEMVRAKPWIWKSQPMPSTC